MIRRWAPAEGWLSVALVFAMGLIVALAVDDAAWVVGDSRLTDFLPAAMLGGLLAGFGAAKIGWGRLRAHVVGATLGALIVPVLVGYVLQPDAGSIAEAYRATATSAVEAWLDLTVRAYTTTRQYGHFLVVLGILMWATGQFAAYAAFRHRRPLAAALVLGVILLIDISATLHDQLPFLVVYTIVALLLLVRLHVFEEQGTWLRRRIGDPTSVARLYERGGSVFVAGAVGGAILLTITASSAPLAGAWQGADTWLIDAGRGLQRYFSFVQSVRGPAGVDFSSTAKITGLWITNNDPAMQITLPAGTTAKYYWQAAVYDSFDGNTGWSWTGDVSADRAANASILGGTLDATTPEGHTPVTITVSPVGYHGTTVVSPGQPLTVGQPTSLRTVGALGFFATLDWRAGDGSYQVTGLEPVLGDKGAQDLTVNKLRAAGTDYPAAIRATYLGVPDGALGPASLELLTAIEGRLEKNDPYDLAAAIVQELHTTKYHYQTDVTDLSCGTRSLVECFVTYKRGYCQYYATTMAMLLRQAGIPTRLVQGFLPGERDGTIETIRNSNSHAWVQVYFPKFGWVDFDPTGGDLSQLPVLPPGAPVPSTSPRASSPTDSGNNEQHRSIAPPSLGPIAGTSGPTSPGGAAYVAIAVLLVVSVGGLAFVAYRRGPRGSSSPDQAYRGVTTLASRLGFAPRPTQTVYEYVAALGDIVPAVRPELQTVARAKVEVAYGRAVLGDDRTRALRDAMRRLRVGLLRLVMRRRERGAFRRSR
jgi:transglutaminase-like putative cysteine protease